MLGTCLSDLLGRSTIRRAIFLQPYWCPSVECRFFTSSIKDSTSKNAASLPVHFDGRVETQVSGGEEGGVLLCWKELGTLWTFYDHQALTQVNLQLHSYVGIQCAGYIQKYLIRSPKVLDKIATFPYSWSILLIPRKLPRLPLYNSGVLAACPLSAYNFYGLQFPFFLSLTIQST